MAEVSANGVYTNFNQDLELVTLMDKMMDQVVDVEDEPSKKSEFRASGFPYCPIIDLEKQVNGETAFQPTYRSNFYTGIGTAIHENLQHYLPFLNDFKKYVWGDWVCRKCGEKDEYGNWTPQVYASLQPEPCKCGAKQKNWTYLEIAFERGELTHDAKKRLKKGKVKEKDLIETDFIPLSGHVDLVFKIGKEFVIIDAKSTSLRKVENPVWTKNFPSLSNVAQISNYSVMFKLKYGKKVRGWCLLYIARDDITSFPARRPLKRAVTHRWTKGDIKKWGDRLFKAQQGRVLVEQVQERGRKKLFKEIVKSRPCAKEGEYNNWMKAKWYGKKECPHKNICNVREKSPTSMVNRIEYLVSAIESETKSNEKSKSKKIKKGKKRK